MSDNLFDEVLQDVKGVEEKLLGATHMDKPVELANQLGRIQREAFFLYGKRFTPEELEDFISQQKSIPENEQFQKRQSLQFIISKNNEE
jgi:hypothetical protein